jgi:hypothetical protein
VQAPFVRTSERSPSRRGPAMTRGHRSPLTSKKGNLLGLRTRSS